MQGSATRKAEKLIHVEITYTDVIKNLELTGDFFVHPEESLVKIEQLITGMKITDISSISILVSSLIEKEGITLIGITPAVIEDVIREALR